MDWPFPIATTPPCLVSSHDLYCSSVEAYASIDRTFARDFQYDSNLKAVFDDLCHGIVRGDVGFLSAKHTILRALLVRADFAVEQKLMLRQKILRAMKKGHKEKVEELQGAIDEVEQEVARVYEVLSDLKEVFSPRLDDSLEQLEQVRNEVDFPNSDMSVLHGEGINGNSQ